jgi:hypothetical protein
MMASGEIHPIFTTKQNCGSCHFSRDGRCRRYPPNKTCYPDRDEAQPVIETDMWCGEWRLKT